MPTCSCLKQYSPINEGVPGGSKQRSSRKYFDTLTGITEENEFVDFIPTTVERGTLQVIGIDILTLWPSMLSARNEIQI